MKTKIVQETEYELDWVVVDPGQPQSQNPGYPPEIEIQDIWMDGIRVTSYRFSELMSRHEEEWIKEIIERRGK